MILPIINFSSYSVYQPSKVVFGGYKQIRVKEIKNLPDLTCPRCGGPIIEPQRYIDAYREITLPLKYMIQKGYMDKSKDIPVIWEILNSFAEKYPNLSLDKILENEKEHDKFRMLVENVVVPGIDRKNRTVYNASKKKFDSLESGIRKSSRRELSKAPIAIENIQPFIQYLRKIEQTDPFPAEVRGKIEAFEYLKHQAYLYPDKTLSEIINLPENKYHIELMKKKNSDEFQEKSDKIFDDFRKIIMSNTDCSETLINGTIYSAKLALFSSSKDPGIRLNNAIKICESFTEQNHCPEIYDKLANLIKQIYEIPFNKYTELANYIGEQNDGKIIGGLLGQYIGSSDHFIARKNGGMDLRQNKISMHKGCNTKQGSEPKTEYIKIYPKYPEYTCEQSRQVSECIYKDMMIPKYYLYPMQNAKNLREETKGIINPDVSEYLQKAIIKSEEKQEAYIKTARELCEKRDLKIAKLMQVKTEEEKQKLRTEIQELNVKINEQRDNLKEERRVYGAFMVYDKELKSH